jgi:fructose-1,6-bisphosphatase
VCEFACSEEVPEPVDMGGEGFSVAFDPLDGSSIVDTNFTVSAAATFLPPILGFVFTTPRESRPAIVIAASRNQQAAGDWRARPLGSFRADLP